MKWVKCKDITFKDEGPHPGRNPDLVVFPSSTQEVAEVDRIRIYIYITIIIIVVIIVINNDTSSYHSTSVRCAKFAVPTKPRSYLTAPALVWRGASLHYM